MVKCPACSCNNPIKMNKKIEKISFGIEREYYKCPECDFEFYEKYKKSKKRK